MKSKIFTEKRLPALDLNHEAAERINKILCVKC